MLTERNSAVVHPRESEVDAGGRSHTNWNESTKLVSPFRNASFFFETVLSRTSTSDPT
jgi:hypothetical protein